MSARPPAVVLCADLARGGVNLDAVRGALSARFPGVQVRVVPGLCRRPSQAAAEIRDAGGGRAVVGACRRLPASAVRTALRPHHQGPFDVAVVRVPRSRGTAAAAATLAAALERLARLPAGEPARRMATTDGLRRGALLRLAPAVRFEPVAAVAAERCAGFDRCGLCAAACPAQALAAHAGIVRVAASDCDACGRCVRACPTGAIHLAGASPTQLEGQLSALLEGGTRDVAFACTSALAALADETALDGWGLIEVPALRIVTPAAVAQAVLAGAAHVWLSPCDGDCCAPWREPDALDLCRLLLGAGPAARVLVGPSPPAAQALEGGSVPRTVRPRLSEPAATVATVAGHAGALAVAHVASSLGLVEAGAGCTACGACAVACPDGALALDEDDHAALLLFDARRCTACGLCAAACPEHVLTLVRGIDAARLAAGPAALASVAARRCRGCGDRLPAPDVLARAREAVAAHRPALADAAPDLCVACACERA